MIVGNIQRLLGVLPAQMSRIIRALEGREPPLISCRINSRDKRKIDVCLTPAGEKTLWQYQEARVSRLVQRLRSLPEEEQEDLTRLVHKLNALLDRLPNLRLDPDAEDVHITGLAFRAPRSLPVLFDAA